MDANSIVAAFLTGVGTSLHCSAMCGPMACAFRVSPLEYHLSRVISYTLAGALCGGIGLMMQSAFRTGPLHLAPWLFLAVLLLMATGLERRIPMPNFLLQLGTRLRFERTLGWLSPLIPCGPLWLMLGVAAATGSILTGSLLLLCFALGTIPLYLGFQLGLGRIQKALGPARLVMLQRSLVWCAAGILAWRLFSPSPNGCCSL
jgi:sulfite exporter TauE/SafE